MAERATTDDLLSEYDADPGAPEPGSFLKQLDAGLTTVFAPINRGLEAAGRGIASFSRPVPSKPRAITERDPLDRIAAGESADEVYGREPTALDRMLAAEPGLAVAAQLIAPGAAPKPKLSRPKKNEAVKSGRGSEEAMIEGAKAGAHLKKREGGKYVGAPEWVDSPQALAAMRKELDRLASDPRGQGWYQSGRDAVSEMTGDVPRANRITANTIGITSPQARPNQNLGYAMQALVNRAVTGEVPPVVRFGAMSKAIEDQIATGGESTRGLGAKTKVFADTLNPDKAGEFHGSTNDIWHKRAFEKNDSWTGTPTKQEHAFMDGETALAMLRANERGLGGDTPLTMPNIQERIWAAKQIESAIASGLTPEEAAKKVLGNTYKDYLDKYTLNATHEFLPGGPTGHLAGMDKVDGLLDRFYGSPATTWATAPGGRDAIYASMDLMPVRPTLPMQGAWKDPVKGFQTNPGEVARPMVDLVEGPGKSRAMGPNIKTAVEGAEALRAYLSAQSGAASHRTSPGQASASSAVHVPLGRPVSPEEMQGIAGAMSKRGYDVSDTGNGLTIVDFSGTRGPAEIKADLAGITADVKRVLPDAGVPKRRVFESTYGDMPFETPGSGAATRTLLDKMDAVPEFGREAMGNSPLVRERAHAMRNRDDLLSKEYGLPLREDIQLARAIFEKEGIEGLRAALKRGAVLPAAAVAIVGAAMMDQEAKP